MITEEEKQRYQREGEKFKKIREGVEIEIGFLEQKIQERKTFLDTTRPSVPKADHECENCGIVSMVYAGRKSAERQLDIDEPPVYTSFEVYKCAVCDNEEEIPEVNL